MKDIVKAINEEIIKPSGISVNIPEGFIIADYEAAYYRQK